MNPPFVEDLTNKANKVSVPWISWFQFATGGGKVSQPAVGGSPFTYHNTTIFKQQAILSVNAISNLQVSRDNSTFYTLSTTLGTPVTLFPGDYLKITYGGSAPTLTIIPI
jgi:hypothetical protein